MEDQNEKRLSQKRTFALEVEVFADSDAELHEIAQDIGGMVFGLPEVLGVSVMVNDQQKPETDVYGGYFGAS